MPLGSKRTDAAAAHIAHLGVRARAYSYAVRGLSAPTAAVYVALDGPDGERLTWGEAAAPPGRHGTGD